jgi:plasmid stabilization system protein ParE
MNYTLVIADRALEMLTEHVCFLAQVSEKAAERLIQEFQNKAKILKLTPERYPWLSDPMLPIHKYRKLLFEKRYLIVYQLKKKTVYIDAVVDCRQDYRWFL